MLKARSLLLNLLAVLLVGVYLAVVVQNMAVRVPVQLLTETFASISLGLLLAGAGLLTAGGLACKMAEQALFSSKQQRTASRELERKEVSREEAQARVKVLENKVETLEKALQEALKAGR